MAFRPELSIFAAADDPVECYSWGMELQDLTPQILEEAWKPRPHIDAKVVDSLVAAFDELQRQHPIGSLDRLRKYLDAFIRSEISPSHPLQRSAYCPGLTTKPFWKAEDVSVFSDLRRAFAQSFDAMREELVGYVANSRFERYGSSERYPTLGKESWSGVPLLRRGSEITEFGKNFPIAISTLEPFFPFILNEVAYLKLEPCVQLPWHFDANNVQVTSHTGFIVPTNCGIRVGNEERTTREGESVFFDHSIIHTAWNGGDEDRTVMVIDFAHPDLTRLERSVLKQFFAWSEFDNTAG